MQFGTKINLQNDWELDMSFTRSVFNRQRTELQDTQSVEYELAINGVGGPNCDPFNDTRGGGNAAYASSGGDFGAGNCYYFNPFGNAYINPDGTPQTDLTLVNPPELYQYLLGRRTDDQVLEQDVFDAVISGSVSDNLGMALGVQRRIDSGSVLFDATMS